MHNLTLGEQSFLTERIVKLFPAYKAEAYELAGKFTREQRGQFLKYDYNSDIENALKVLEEVAE